MRFIGADTETHPIKPGLLAPRMVCLSWAAQDHIEGLELRQDGLPIVKSWLTDPDITLVWHNAPFDLGVLCAEDAAFLPLVFDAYDAGRIICTIVRQKVIDVALGMRKWRRARGRVERASYGLADLVKLYYDEHLEKDDTWRLRYALLDGVPISEWPIEAREYAIRDAIEALRIRDTQESIIIEHFDGDLPNQIEQQRASWALHLMSMWGIRAERERVDYFIGHCEREIAAMHERLKDTAIFKPDGSRTMAEIRQRVVKSLTELKIAVPRTDPSARFPEGQVQTDKDTLLLTDDPELHVLAESMTFVKHLGQWGPVLRAAQDRPVLCRYETLVETGRTASSGSEGQEGTNIQNPPRKGDVRPCIVPRKGWLLCSTDADTIELRAHAQNCLELVGWSKMAEALIEQARSGGPDLHERLAAAIVGIDPRELQARRRAGDADAIDARQFAKIPNFGFPGGLGAKVFVAYAAAQLDRDAYLRWFGASLEGAIRKAQLIRNAWFETFPENKPYFDLVGEMTKGGSGIIRQRMSGRIRGDVRFTSAANGFFQGRVADAMKEILWRLARECYLPGSILYGSRPVMFLHDEPILEHPEDGSESMRAERQRQIVVEVLSKWLPDIPCTSSAVLTRRWHKGAEPLRVNGLLVPVKPEKINGKTKWVHDISEMREAA